MNLDLDAMSLNELKSLKSDIDKAIKGFHQRKIAEARQELQAKAKELGVSLDEVLGKKKATRQPAPPKYRHPEDPTMTWNGRGRKPNWIVAAEKAGTSLEKLLIK